MKIKYKNKSGKRIVKKCKNCDEEFETLMTKVRAKGEHFCCIDCYNTYRRNNKQDEKLLNVYHQKKHKYNLNKDEYLQLLIDSKNKCAICNNEFKNTNRHNAPCVDHDHKTNVVRGILCHRCNKGIGLFEDNLILLENAIKYLNRNISM